MGLLRARETTMRLFRPMLASYKITEQQWRVLRALSAANQPIGVGELANRTFILAPSLSRILANLEGRKYIRRLSSGQDQRCSLVELSAQGVTLVSEVAPRSEAVYNTIEQEFGQERLARLMDELYDLAALEIEATSHTKPPQKVV